MNNDVSSKRRLSRFLQEGRGCCSETRGTALVVEPSRQKTPSWRVGVVTPHGSLGTLLICAAMPNHDGKGFVVVLKMLIIRPAAESIKSTCIAAAM